MSVAVYKINFRVASNEDWNHPFQLLSGGSPRDLTGCTLTLGVAKCTGGNVWGSPTVVALTISNAGQGQFTVAVPAATIATLGPGKFAHDLILTDGAGKKSRVWFGDLEIERGVQ